MVRTPKDQRLWGYANAKMDSLTVKTIAVFAIIFGCFAVLYPKIFHPMFANMFGAAPAQQADNDMCKAVYYYVNIISFCVNEPRSI